MNSFILLVDLPCFLQPWLGYLEMRSLRPLMLRGHIPQIVWGCIRSIGQRHRFLTLQLPRHTFCRLGQVQLHGRLCEAIPMTDSPCPIVICQMPPGTDGSITVSSLAPSHPIHVRYPLQCIAYLLNNMVAACISALPLCRPLAIHPFATYFPFRPLTSVLGNR